MRYQSTCEPNLRDYEREPSRVSSLEFCYKDALILVGIECIKVHQEQNLITKQLLQLVANNPSKKIYGFLPKKCNGPT